jgi:predicted heme/steroid binding protein
MASEKNEFSREELQQHNGKDQPTVYVGFEGEVYDVSESKLWLNYGAKMTFPL